MALGVVDELETVEVEHQNGEIHVRSPRRLDRSGQVLVQDATVGASSKGVDPCCRAKGGSGRINGFGHQLVRNHEQVVEGIDPVPIGVAGQVVSPGRPIGASAQQDAEQAGELGRGVRGLAELPTPTPGGSSQVCRRHASVNRLDDGT
jgi:hypothetical protein